MTGAGNQQILTHAGFGVCVDANGIVSEPYRVPAPVVAEMSRQMRSDGKQTGGVSRPPQNREADLGLYQDRTQEFGPTAGPDVVLPQWAGNAVVQSGANAGNQPAPAPAPVVVENGTIVGGQTEPSTAPVNTDNSWTSYTPTTNYQGSTYLVGPSFQSSSGP